MAEHGDSDNSKPLAGVVMCCTAITPERRSELAGIAQQMGALHKFDLTSDVTHLLVGDINTPKYKYVAKERPDVKVVLPEWLEAVRQSWMGGGATDVPSLEAEHAVPVFHGLRISMTGFSDQSFRQQLSETIIHHGAEYSPDLTRSITQLIAATPEGKKYTYARQWNIKVVSLNWLQDSIQRGMTLDESAYDPLKPEEEQGKGAWNTMPSPATVLGKRSRGGPQQNLASDAMTRKLRRTASAKLGSQNESIWADITSHTSHDRRKSESEWLDLTNRDPPIEAGRSKSVAVPQKKASIKSLEVSSESREHQQQRRPSNNDGIFEQRVVYVHGFDEKKTAILHEHLRANDATICTTSADLDIYPYEDLEQGYLIVPDDVPSIHPQPIPASAARLLKVTNWWVEKCLYSKTLIDPVVDAFSRPFLKHSLDDFKNVTVTSTGFTSIDLLHISKAVKLMGATYAEYLTNSTSILICSPTAVNQEKLRFAAENKIPAVTLDWLLHCVEFGEKKPLKEYLVQTSNTTPDDTGKQLIEVPTRPLSEEEKNALQKNMKSKTSKPTPDHRKVPQRPTEHTIDKTKRKPKINAEPLPPYVPPEENLPITQGSSSSHPLQELTDMNSPRRSSASASTKSSFESGLTKNPTTAPEPLSAKPDLDSAIAALLAQKQASRPTSAAPPEGQPETNRQRRRKGLLGRASSATSHTASNPSVHEQDAEGNAQGDSIDTDDPATLDQMSNPKDKWAPESEHGEKSVPEPPQTQLFYENPEAQRAREIMLEKLGGALDDQKGRMKKIGTVRDLASDNGAAGKAGRRKR